MPDLTFLLDDWSWMLQAFLSILAALVLDVVQKRMLNRLVSKLETGTRNPWDEAVVGALTRPLSLAIWVLGITLAADIVQRATDAAALFVLTGSLRKLGIIAALTWFLLSLVRNGEQAYINRESAAGHALDRATVTSIGRLFQLSILITAALVALQNLGFSITGVLAVGGVGGVAIGFAAKDLLANFFGTLIILLDRPFAVGDWIRSPDKEIEGVVEHISWRVTRIRTFDKRPLYVPNSTFSSISVENPSRMSNRRIYEIIGIRYDDVGLMDGIVSGLKAMLMEHPEIDTGQTLIVNFNTFAPSSLDFFIYTFTKTTEWVRYHEIKHDVLLKVAGIIQEHGAEIAFPTSTVHLSATGRQPVPEPNGAGNS